MRFQSFLHIDHTTELYQANIFQCKLHYFFLLEFVCLFYLVEHCLLTSLLKILYYLLPCQILQLYTCLHFSSEQKFVQYEVCYKVKQNDIKMNRSIILGTYLFQN